MKQDHENVKVAKKREKNRLAKIQTVLNLKIHLLQMLQNAFDFLNENPRSWTKCQKYFDRAKSAYCDNMIDNIAS